MYFSNIACAPEGCPLDRSTVEIIMLFMNVTENNHNLSKHFNKLNS